MKRIFRSPVTSIVLFLIAAVCLIFSSIQGARAVLNIGSADYRAEIVLDEINVGLTERSEGDTEARDISHEGALLTHLIPEGKSFTLGTAYAEELGVKNTGAIDEYVRVTVYKYWTKNGVKDPDLDPALIDLHFVTGSGWEIDADASTKERTVLYYMNGPIASSGGTTAAFTDTLTISPDAAASEYAGAICHIEAKVDAVQNHNAQKAIVSSWGHNFPGVTD